MESSDAPGVSGRRSSRIVRRLGALCGVGALNGKPGELVCWVPPFLDWSHNKKPVSKGQPQPEMGAFAASLRDFGFTILRYRMVLMMTHLLVRRRLGLLAP